MTLFGMPVLAIASWRIAVMGRWAACIAGTLMVLLFLTIAAGEGLPAPSGLTLEETLQFVGLFGLAAGLLMAWRWEGLGGLIGVAAFVLLAAIGSGHLRMGALRIPAAVAVVHVVCWGRLRAGAPAGLVPWHLQRVVLAGMLVALAVFLLLCANEIFGQPPLMVPELRPQADLAGTWRATATPQVLLTIHPDGTVSGAIGHRTITQARIRYGRSWFGKLMRFSSEYLIAGTLANEVPLAEGLGDKRFTIPLTEREGELQGALFFAGQPVGIQLVRE